MLDHVIVDLESQKLADELPGKWNDVHLMGVSCAVVYEYSTDRFRLYGPDDLEALKARLLKADRITSYNGERFDFPCLWALPNRQMPKELVGKSDDLLRRIAVARNVNPDFAHKGWGLDSVARGTIGRGKIDCGTHAPALFKEGKWGQLFNYCCDDVALTRDLSAFTDKYGYAINEKKDLVVLQPWRPRA
jgi:DEAD/DEAH box helicase domain-containing protein